jgi:hypothetical protein
VSLPIVRSGIAQAGGVTEIEFEPFQIGDYPRIAGALRLGSTETFQQIEAGLRAKYPQARLSLIVQVDRAAIDLKLLRSSVDALQRTLRTFGLALDLRDVINEHLSQTTYAVALAKHALVAVRGVEDVQDFGAAGDVFGITFAPDGRTTYADITNAASAVA